MTRLLAAASWRVVATAVPASALAAANQTGDDNAARDTNILSADAVACLMYHPLGARMQRADRVDFDRRLRVAFQGVQPGRRLRLRLNFAITKSADGCCFSMSFSS